MRYLALLYGREDATAEPGTAEFAEEVACFEAFEAVAGDAIVAGEALEPTRVGLTVRHGPAGPVVTDGVHAETAEVVGGLYVLEAENLDAAVGLASGIPAAAAGAVELRPLVEWFEDVRPLLPATRRYLALLTGPESEADHPGTDAWDRAVAEHARFAREAGEAIVGGAALHPAETGTVVRSRGGEVLVTEGTFAETTEIVGVSPRRLGGSTAGVAVLVEDVDDHHRHALEQGAAIDYAPVDQPYGYREYGARDPEGGLWSFMQPLD